MTRRLALNLRGAFYSYSVKDYGDPAWSVALAPQIRVLGKYLNGAFLGLSFDYGGPYDDSHNTRGNISIEGGYQWVHSDRLVFGIIGGCQFYDFQTSYIQTVYLNCQLGFTFKHPFIRAR